LVSSIFLVFLSFITSKKNKKIVYIEKTRQLFEEKILISARIFMKTAFHAL